MYHNFFCFYRIKNSQIFVQNWLVNFFASNTKYRPLHCVVKNMHQFPCLSLLFNNVFRLECFTKVLEFTNLGKNLRVLKAN